MADKKKLGNSAFTENTGNFSKKVEKAQKKSEKAGQRLDKAKSKLPKRREYTLQRVFDEKSGKGKYVVIPMEKEKPFKGNEVTKFTMEHLQNGSKNFVHGKVSEVEQENAAVEGAHKAEQKGEEVIRFVKRRYKGKNQRQREKIARLEKKQFKADVNFQYQKFLEENPQIQKKAFQKQFQKQRIKREYAKARQKGKATKAAGEAVSKTANAAGVVAKRLQEIAQKNASVIVVVGIMSVFLIMIMTSISSCGAMFSNMTTTTLTDSYLSEPIEIDATDLAFTRLKPTIRDMMNIPITLEQSDTIHLP